MASLDGNPVEIYATINFTSSEAFGTGGCNSFNGHYKSSDASGEISFSDVFSTLMACANGDAGQLEASYFAALISAQSYQIKGGILTISGSGSVLVFEPAM